MLAKAMSSAVQSLRVIFVLKDAKKWLVLQPLANHRLGNGH